MKKSLGWISFLLIGLVYLGFWNFFVKEPYPAEANSTLGLQSIYLPLVTDASTGISIEGGAFSLHTIGVSPGTVIRWTNNDVVPHQLLSDDGVFTSPELAPGETYSWLATQTGIYPCISTYTSGIEGEILVLEGGPETLFEGEPVDDAYLDYCSGYHGPERGAQLVPH